MANIVAAADLIEPHIDGAFRRPDRALGTARDLHDAGLLAGCTPRTASRLPVREAAVNVLQCRQPWSVAERIAAALDDAGLLRSEES